MGVSASRSPVSCITSLSNKVRCEETQQPHKNESNSAAHSRHTLSSSPPPALHKHETADQRLWRNFMERPLLPIGCGVTAYFLFSGIRSFQKRDPVTSQRMMRNRVAAQFVTLLCLLGYIGSSEIADFRLAPQTQDAWKKKQEEGNPQE